MKNTFPKAGFFALAAMLLGACAAILAQEPIPATPALYTLTIHYRLHPPLSRPGEQVVTFAADSAPQWSVVCDRWITPQVETSPPFFRAHLKRVDKALRDIGTVDAVDRVELGDGAWASVELQAIDGVLLP